jgi:glutamate 5-kinase
MVTKLQAVKLAVQSGIPAFVASGLEPGVLQAILTGQPIGTHFHTKE